MAVHVSGINPDTTREVLEMFFESSKRSGGGDIKDLMYDRDKHTAIIWFEDDKVRQRCIEFSAKSTIPLDGFTLVLHSRSHAWQDTAVHVSGINPDTTREILEMFFESSKRSGGGDIKDLMFDRDKHTAIIWFEDDKVRQRCIGFSAKSTIQLDRFTLVLHSRSHAGQDTAAAVHIDGSQERTSGPQSSQVSGKDSLRDGSHTTKAGVTQPNPVLDTVLTRDRNMGDSEGAKPAPPGGQGSVTREATDGENFIASKPTLERSQLAEYDFHTVELKNIPPDTTEECLELVVDSVFVDAGEKAISKFKYNQTEHRAWVKLANKEYAHELVLSSPLDVDGIPVHVVPLNTLLEDDPDYPRSAAIMVLNVPNGITDQHIRLFFKNRKKSDGGEIENIHRVISAGSVCVTFEEASAAERVLQKHDECSLQLKQQPLDIQRLKALPPPPLCVGAKEIDRLILTSLPESIAGGDIKEFLSNKDCLVSKVLFSCKPGVALVIFDDFPDYDSLLWRCGTKPLKDTIVSIQEIPLPTHIQVHGIWGLDLEMVQLYFDEEGDVVSSSVSPDKTWIIYQLRDHDVVKRTAGKPHSLEGKAIAVEAYYADFGEFPPGIDLTIPLNERRITNFVKTGGPVGRFIVNSREAISFLNDGLKSHNAVVDTRDSSDEQLTLTCNIAMGASEINTWKDKSASILDTLVRDSFAAVTLTPEADIFQPVTQKACEYAKGDRVMVITDKDTQTLTIAGWREEVLEAEACLYEENQAIEDDNSAEECVIPVQEEEALILQVSDYRAEAAKRFPKLKVTFGKKDVILRGPTRHMSDAKVMMYEQYTRQKRTRTETLTKDETDFLQLDKASAYVTKELSAAGVNVAWHVTGEGKLTIISLKEKNLDLAMDCIKRSFVHQRRAAVAAESAVLNTQHWKTWVSSLRNQHKNMLLIHVKSEELQWTCVRDIARHIDAEVNKYFVEHVIHEEFVSVVAGVVEILEQNGDMRRIQEAAKVDVEARLEDRKRAGCLLKGSRSDIEKARKAIHRLVPSVESSDHVLRNAQEIRYVNSPKGELTLENLRTMYKCAIGVVQEGDTDTEAMGQDEDDTDTEAMGQDEDEDSHNSQPDATSHGGVSYEDQIYGHGHPQTFVTKEGVLVTQVVGRIERETAQVLVNTTQRDLNLSAGSVSAAILREAGISIQRECKQKCPRGIKDGAIVVTSAGNLHVKYIFHGQFGSHNKSVDHNLKLLREMLRKCLDLADRKGQTSLATPAIGTGNLGLPRKDCATLMYDVIQNFSKRNPDTSLKDIRIVLHPDDKETIQAFVARSQTLSAGVRDVPTSLPPKPTWRAVNNASRQQRPSPSPRPTLVDVPQLTGTTGYPPETVHDTTPSNFQRTPNTSDLVTTTGMIITQKTGCIEQENVDVIMNTTNCQLRLDAGGVSAAIYKAAGPSIQAECQEQAPKGIQVGDVITTSGGNLTAKYVIHGAALPWDGANGRSLQVLQQLMVGCLTEGMEKKATSMAFPVIGTGNYGMPRDVVAEAMYRAILTFSARYPSTTIKDVRIMMHHSDKETIQAFGGYLNSISPPNAVASAASTSAATDETPTPGTTAATPTPGATAATPTPVATAATPTPGATASTPTPVATTATPTPGATVATPTPLPTSATPTPLSTAATLTPSSRTKRTLKPKTPSTPGQSRQDTRRRNKSDVGYDYDYSRNGALTVDFGPATLQVYQGDLTKERVDVIVNSTNKHLNLQQGAVSNVILKEGGASIQEECNQIGGTNREGIAISRAGKLPCQNILHLAMEHVEMSMLIRRGLQELEATGRQSVAFPVLGTGTRSTSTALFAKDFWEAITQFLAKDHRGCIRDIRVVVYQTAMVRDLQKELTELVRLTPKTIGVTESSPSPTRPRGGDTITLRFHSLSMRSITRAIKGLKQHIDSAMKTQVIGGEEDQEALSNLTEDLTAKIYAVGDKYFVDIEIYHEHREQRLKVSGLQDDVYPATTEVSKLLRKAEQMVKEGRDIEIVMETVKWEFSDDGETFETYSQEIGAIIEKAYRAKMAYAEWEEEDHEYRIDFKKMEEEIVGDAGESVPVRRRDITEAMSLPSTWTTHSDISSVKRVVLKAESKEYQQVQLLFTTTGCTGTIEQIERIESPALYRQYDVHRTRMNADNPPGHQNERILYHGTSADTVETINRNGFDRRFCGKNAVLHGKGVYFAHGAYYSARPTYSPPDANGVKYMYQCKVLTGEFCQSAQDLRKPPPKPGNSSAVLYDTVVDDPANPGIFVVFNDTQAYPEYLIQFKA